MLKSQIGHPIKALEMHEELCPEGGGLIIGDFVTADGSVIPPDRLGEYHRRGEPFGLDYKDEIPFGLCALIAMWNENEKK